MTAQQLRSAAAHAATLLGPLAQLDHPLGALTTYRVGGPAAVFVEVGSEEDLALVAAAAGASGIETLVLGQGSNLLVADAGFPGLAVRLGPAFATLALDLEAATADAGGATPYPVLARQSAAAGLAGLEWAVGVPGSVGGAVCMNAGGHGSETAAVLVSARVVDLAGGVSADGGGGTRSLSAAELAFSYRHSAVGESDVVVAASFALGVANAGECRARLGEIVRWRRENQPGGQNAGSVFTNPPGDSAGRLIDAAGLKGFRVGSAEVSAKHANFVQADAGGSADDVARLIDEVRRLVQERTGVVLQPEVRRRGFAR